MSPPLQDKITNLEATMVEWRKVKAELAKSRVELFMEETKANVQIQPILFKRLKEEMTPKATSYTQLRLENYYKKIAK